MSLPCHSGLALSPAPKRKRPLQSYPMEPDLIAGLARLARREHLPVAALVRRAIRRELEREGVRSEEHTSELQSLAYLVCRLLLEKKKKKERTHYVTKRNAQARHHDPRHSSHLRRHSERARPSTDCYPPQSRPHAVGSHLLASELHAS